MKLLGFSALCFALWGAGASVEFEADGVKVGDLHVTGAVLSLKDTAAGAVLVSGSVVEPLAGAVTVSLAPGREIVVEPGVRVERVKDSFLLTTHGRRTVRVGELALEAPVALKVTAGGWDVAGKALEGATLKVSLASEAAAPPASPEITPQDTATRRYGQDRATRRYRTRARIRSRRVFSENPFPSTEAIDTETLRFLPNVSPE